MQEIILKVRYFDRGLSKSLKKVTQKQKGPETSDQWLFRLQNKFRKITLLVMYYLTKFGNVI